MSTNLQMTHGSRGRTASPRSLAPPSPSLNPVKALSADQLLLGAWLSVSASTSLREILDTVTQGACDLIGSNIGVTGLAMSPDWTHALLSVSLSATSTGWRTDRDAPDGTGIYAIVCQENRSLRLTQAELLAHPAWSATGRRGIKRFPLRGLLAVPIVARDGSNLGLIHVSDKVDGTDFTSADESILMVFASMTATSVERATTERRLHAILDHAPVGIFVKDRAGRYVLANAHASNPDGVDDGPSMPIPTIDQLFPAELADLHTMIDERVLDGDVVETESRGTGRQADRIFHVVRFPVLDETGRSDGIGGIITDVTDLRAAETERSTSDKQYRALFERSIDAILVADDTGRYVDANPAASVLFGLSREALMGRRSFDLIDEEWARGPNMEAGWRAFLKAGSHTGAVRLLRDDGGVRLVEYSAMANLALGRHTWVLRDVSARSRSEHLVAQRVRSIESLERMQPGLTPELTAAAICAEITRHIDLPNAAIIAFEADGTGSALASSFAGDLAQGLPRRISDNRSIRLRERAADGAWMETRTQATDPVLWADLASGGGDLVAFAPIRVGDEVMGLLMVGDGPLHTDRLVLVESVEEFAALTSSVLGPPLSERRRVREARARISRILADHTFHPVFQTVVDLQSGDVSGYEALTRFDDGTAPDRMFALAAVSGLGLALERATIEASLDAASSLRSDLALSINVSPALVLAGEQLHRLLDRTTCDIVLEITEHEPVLDYRALRKAVARFGDRIRLSVDDAGAGFASLRHILELRPAIVKLDRGLVEGVDTDPVRQALVAGMVHFARRAGTILIGEGIETEAERTTLLALGVQAGQGFLFGRPAPLPESTASMAG